MRLVDLRATNTPDGLPDHAIVCHDVRNPAQRSELLARKGSRLSSNEVLALLGRGVAELHLAVPEPGDLDEDAAAARLAAAVAGPGVREAEAHFGETNLISARRGMLRVNVARLERVNALNGVLVLT